jgi:hypothetical protein
VQAFPGISYAAMKAPLLAIVTVGLALGATVSCHPGYSHHAAGYDQRDAYNRGHADGSSDRLSGRDHNPHINEDSETLPSAYRNDYIWGYVEGYKNPYVRVSAGSK